MENLLKGGCVTSLVFLFLIFLAMRGCSEQSEKEAEYWKDKTECDCIRAYTKDKLSIYDLMIPEECGGLFGLSSYHPCQDIVGLSINNIYNQDSTNIEFDYKEEFLKEYFQDTITTFNCHFQ